MTNSTTWTVQIDAALNEFTSSRVQQGGAYDNVSGYLRDLVRRDMAAKEQQAFDRLKAKLTHAYAAPEASYQPLTAAEVIARNKQRGA